MSEKNIPADIRIKAVAAAQAVYRLSDIATFDPALKLALRKKATEVFSHLTGSVLYSGSRKRGALDDLVAVIATLEELIAFARELGYVTTENATRVEGAYVSLTAWARGELDSTNDEASEAVSRREPHAPPLPDENNVRPPDTFALSSLPLNERQRRIIHYLSATGRAQISNIRSLFSDEYSEKTLQRDLWQLINHGFIRRQGARRSTAYISIRH